MEEEDKFIFVLCCNPELDDVAEQMHEAAIPSHHLPHELCEVSVQVVSKLTLFGRDVSKIPCFRNSWLYGISGGIGTGLLYFLFTSKPRNATHVGFSGMVCITMSYWFICRYEWSRQSLELQKMKEYVEKRVLIEGTEMEKLYEAEVATVSHTTQRSV